jgi:hypothetical protein
MTTVDTSMFTMMTFEYFTELLSTLPHYTNTRLNFYIVLAPHNGMLHIMCTEMHATTHRYGCLSLFLLILSIVHIMFLVYRCRYLDQETPASPLAHSSPPLPLTNNMPSTPKKPKSSVLPTQETTHTNATSSDLDQFAGQPRFTLSNVADIHSSSFALGYSNSERQAAARALLRYDSHLDSTHYHTRTTAGLHPSYIAFNEALTSPDQRMITHEEFVEAALQDIFDAVSLFPYFSLLFLKDIHILGLHARPSRWWNIVSHSLPWV